MTFDLISILAQATPPVDPAAQPQGPLGQLFASPLVFMGLIFVIFYFLLIRPQQKRAKDQQALVNAVKTGDKVLTTSGIHGLITNVKDTSVIVKIADNVKVEMEKSAIATVTKRSDVEVSVVS